MINKKIHIYTLALCGLIASCSPAPQHKSPVGDTLYDKDWQFFRSNNALDLATAQQQKEWEPVQIPHTPKIEPLVVNEQFQGDAWYKKTIATEESWKGKQISLKFEAAMNVAEVWLNGEKLITHVGGYLPFTVNLTEKLKWDTPNELMVRLDNRDNPITGPKPLKDLDFNTYGGIYRHVYLQVNNDLHITDAVAAGKTASGGIFVSYPQVTAEQATIRIKTHLANAHIDPKKFRVVQKLLAGDKVVVDQTGELQTVNGKTDAENTIDLVLANPQLWSPKTPNLYHLVTRVYEGDSLVDEQTTRIGIREFKWVKNHLLINGEATFLRGVNRHQEYPYVGYATSDAADYRDAVKIKSAGFDYVRLSHYPHSPAFMAAADELGLVLLDSILGWQYFSEDPAFQAQIQQTCRDLIRRDRNHPSVMAWECSLNESWMTEPFIDSLTKIIDEEYPGAMSAGWQEYGYDIYLQARQHRLEHYKEPSKPYIVSEYGDWEYYAMNAGLNQTEWANLLQADRSSRQLLSDGETRLLQQASNIQEAHNDNFNTPAFADGYWVMFDYNRGYAPDLESSGIMSIDRLPKYSYYFYQSQRDASEVSDKFTSGPMVFIASEWNEKSDANVRVFSNADEVELLLNGKIIAKQTPDKNDNSKNLKNPPFNFALEKYEAGELKAIGYINGKAVAEHKVVTAGTATNIRLTVDTSGKAPQAGVKDIVFVYAQLVDSKGNLVRTNNIPVTFGISGNAKLISPVEVSTSSGIASALVELGDSLDNINISATSDNLAGTNLKL
ncbi:glycoside hydrolase family 2 protein [Cellvibrio fibrivorans]|uniref:Beta-galactosidase n=1 Tax=Cellvibrio fibrivorans TaxID=126350 RepID=A0ABU1UY05_9GAMM|nr:glycoside hydrolase family 2 TIM barrel-domain containing protein [Cellvibrio fibrivorans]MDR7090079.1 beta-galactosidase [Cellvibrio fibrivorans]